ncbi:hypothetical protein LCGC14_1958790 [marine sediment metagenome]|uniref:Uncharacterized protein n=1 Tax=marine sediment metagenome TaxID=412755 RepID=A0A0F9ICA3_9ZZZZ
MINITSIPPFEDNNDSYNLLSYWTRRFYLSCNRLSILGEMAEVPDYILEMEKSINKFFESKMLKAYNLKSIFNVEVGNIYDN